MVTLPPVLHSAAARPVTVAEFADAVRATCRPRFPHLGSRAARPLGLAISGGVDSMALAFLAGETHRQHPRLVVTDSPVSAVYAVIVNHRLRPEAEAECRATAFAVRRFGLKPIISTIRWKRELRILPPVGHPNVETLARRMRYRHLGLECAYHRIGSLLVAHHADDQYETVLMRMLAGHSSRGLRGIRPAGEIPECEGLYGAFRSGWLDDRLRPTPFFNHHNAEKDRFNLRKRMSSLMSDELASAPPESSSGAHDEMLWNLYHGEIDTGTGIGTGTLESSAIEVEDGGIMVYRPLLEFSKARLIATCLENDISWHEDATNADATLTTRNAIRAMSRQHKLPRALSLPAILALSRRCSDKHQALEAEAARAACQVTFQDFNSQAGTLLVQFPTQKFRLLPWQHRSELRHRARLVRCREVAGLVLKHVMAVVSPEHNGPPVTSLQNAINTIFPALSLGSIKDPAAPALRPFNLNGVLFRPVRHTSLYVSSKAASRGAALPDDSYSWYLTREPFPSPVSKPLPLKNFRYCLAIEQPFGCKTKDITSDWTEWMAWVLWDGRFWIRLRHRLPFQPFIGPFQEEHSKPFRDRLHDKRSRDRLGDLLKRHAPGKTRYTLPAIYLETEIDLDDPPPLPGYPYRLPEKLEAQLTPRSMVLALPSLGVDAPGLEKLVEYEIRYKRIDRQLLNGTARSGRASYVPPDFRAGRHSSRRQFPGGICRSKTVWARGDGGGHDSITFSDTPRPFETRRAQRARREANKQRRAAAGAAEQHGDDKSTVVGDSESQFVLGV
ncbi:tRNA(Ile)-lysidine synthase [Microdochium nivale]|nr:tRNA(Ile)-lysidine synthase [Microdochium nivale]